MLQIPDHVRGLIFDCDGTIADTMPLHYRAWTQTLCEQGIDFGESAFYEMAGIPSARIVEILNERHGWSLSVKGTVDRKESLFEAMLPQAGPIQPVVDVIHRYSGKLPMAVATGGCRHLCRATLNALKLLEYFRPECLVTSDDVKHGKPAPDIFLEAARRIAVRPELCCAFEDGEPGLRAARAAGMVVLDVRTVYPARVSA